MQKRPTYNSGAIAALFAALCWGVSTVMSKAALVGFAPVTLLVLQLSVSVACLWSLVWLRRPERTPWRTVAKFAWLGLLEPGLAYLLDLTGLANTEASGATLIQSSESILIVLASAMLFREWPSRCFLVLSILALGGLLLSLGLVTPVVAGDGFIGKLLILSVQRPRQFMSCCLENRQHRRMRYTLSRGNRRWHSCLRYVCYLWNGCRTQTPVICP